MMEKDARDLLKKALDPATGMAISLGVRGVLAGTIAHKLYRNRQFRQIVEQQARRRRVLTGIGLGVAAAGAAGAGVYAAVKHDKSASSDKEKIEHGRHQLRRMVRPIAKGLPYKTKGAQGWDVMVDAVLGDSQASGTGGK